MLQRGHSGDGCALASTLCKYTLRKGATSEAGKYLFRADNVWRRSAQYFVIASCGYVPIDNRCMYMAYVCLYVCCSDCIGSVGSLLCSGRC